MHDLRVEERKPSKVEKQVGHNFAFHQFKNASTLQRALLAEELVTVGDMEQMVLILVEERKM